MNKTVLGERFQHNRRQTKQHDAAMGTLLAAGITLFVIGLLDFIVIAGPNVPST